MDIEIFKKGKNEEDGCIELYEILNCLKCTNDEIISKFNFKIDEFSYNQQKNLHKYLTVWLNFIYMNSIYKHNSYSYSFKNKGNIYEIKVNYSDSTIQFNGESYRFAIIESKKEIEELEELELNKEMTIIEVLQQEAEYRKETIIKNMRTLQNIEYKGFTLELENVNTRETNKFKTLVEVLDYIISVN